MVILTPSPGGWRGGQEGPSELRRAPAGDLRKAQGEVRRAALRLDLREALGEVRRAALRLDLRKAWGPKVELQKCGRRFR